MKENIKEWLEKPYSNGTHVAEIAIGAVVGLIPAAVTAIWYKRTMNRLRDLDLDGKTEENSEDKED